MQSSLIVFLCFQLLSHMSLKEIKMSVQNVTLWCENYLGLKTIKKQNLTEEM